MNVNTRYLVSNACFHLCGKLSCHAELDSASVGIDTSMMLKAISKPDALQILKQVQDDESRGEIKALEN